LSSIPKEEGGKLQETEDEEEFEQENESKTEDNEPTAAG
jgi:hypothetical protein